MYHVECIDIHKTDKMYLYIDRACLCANNMYNVANFHIRNLMTGLKKEYFSPYGEREVSHTDLCIFNPCGQLLPQAEALRKDIQDLSGQESFRRHTQNKALQSEIPSVFHADSGKVVRFLRASRCCVPAYGEYGLPVLPFPCHPERHKRLL